MSRKYKRGDVLVHKVGRFEDITIKENEGIGEDGSFMYICTRNSKWTENYLNVAYKLNYKTIKATGLAMRLYPNIKPVNGYLEVPID